MAQKKYGVLIAGAGWVSMQHISAYMKNPHAEVRAICDVDLSKARQRAEEFQLPGAALYDNVEDAVKHEGVDLVSICTPQHVHCENALAAAAAGKHMLIEKPAANSPGELREMQNAVQRAGVKTVVGFVLRWNPLVQEIKRRLADGVLGEVFCVETDYQSYNSDWWGGWEQGRRKDLAVSAMAVAGCHAVDALRWFATTDANAAAEPVEVFGYAGGKRKGKAVQFNPTTCQWYEQSPMEYDGLEMLLVRFSNGVLGKVSVNFEAVQPYTFPIRVYGDRGTIRDNRLFAPATTGNDWVELPGIRPESSDVTHHPFQAEIDHFIDCVRNDVESHCNLADAIRTHDVFFAAEQCYREPRPVGLPLQ